MNYLILALILVVIIGIIVFITRKRENFSDYNAPNDFMKIYYSSIAQDPNFDKRFPFLEPRTKRDFGADSPITKVVIPFGSAVS